MNPDETTVVTPEEVTEIAPDATADPIDGIEDVNELRKIAKSHRSVAQRYKKDLKQPIIKKEEPDLKEIHTKISTLELSERKRQFGYEHTLSPEETDAVFNFKPNPTKEDLNNPFLKGGLEALRAKKRVEQGIPSSSSSALTVDGKTFGELKPEERAKNWDKVKQKYAKR